MYQNHTVEKKMHKILYNYIYVKYMDTKQYPITFRVHEWIVKGRKVLNKYLYTHTHPEPVSGRARKRNWNFLFLFFS